MATMPYVVMTQKDECVTGMFVFPNSVEANKWVDMLIERPEWKDTYFLIQRSDNPRTIQKMSGEIAKPSAKGNLPNTRPTPAKR